MQKLRQDIHLGSVLRTLRKQTGLTQDQVAARLQVKGSDTTRSVYSRYETGELNIKVSDLIGLRQVFDCEYNDFFRAFDDELEKDRERD